MTIVVTGGGSGGHITPILAVAAELKKLQSDVRIVYIGQKGDGLADVPAQDPNIDEVYSISAGKFRRYHGEGLKQLLDLPTMFKNIRDSFRVLIGLWQSFWLLGRLKPEVIFIKGGFVGVPVGLTAAVRHIPFVTHDSDAIPGLANRIIARWAKVHTVALPEEVYVYPRSKTVTVGVPVHHEYQPITESKKRHLREAIGFGAYEQVILLTGGGLGAQRLNEAFAAILPDLLEEFPKLAVVELVGRAHETAIRSRYERELTPARAERVQVRGYVSDLYNYSGASDVIITRAGATTLAEFAVQGKACIVVPNPLLTGGHQTKNARYLAGQGAVEVIEEEALERDPALLKKAVVALLEDKSQQAALSERLAKFAHSAAAKELAMILLEQARTNG